MDIDMACQAPRELFVESRFMRFSVTVGTLRHITVFILVAGYTGQATVLAGVIGQLGEYLGMAGCTGA